MKRIRSLIAGAFAALALATVGLAQTTVTPGSIYDYVANTITAQVALVSSGTLSVATTSTLTGVVTAPAGVVGNVTGNVTGGITSGTTGITPASISVRNIATGGYPAIISTSGNNSTPSTTETYVTEIFVPFNATITGVAIFNGSDVTGNMTVGLATAAGAPIAAAVSASTAGSGPDTYQRVPFAVAYAAKGPATYYIQVQYSSATARYNTHTVGNFGCLVQTGQTYGTLASFTAPTTFVTNVCNMASLY